MISFFIIFVIGLSIGSFINAFEYRLENNMGINGRSICPHCKKQLAWYDLFPVLSFVFLKGKCRYCKKKISWQYPLIEILTAISTVVIFNAFSFLGKFESIIFTGTNFKSAVEFSISAILLLIIIGSSILVALYDYKTQNVYMKAIYLIFIASLLFVIIQNYSSGTIILALVLFRHLLAGLVAFGFFWALNFFSRGKWMGDGDAFIALGIALFCGPAQTLVALYTAFVSGSLLGVYNIVRKKMTRKTAISFGPFLVFGFFVAVLFGKNIIEWYSQLFLYY